MQALIRRCDEAGVRTLYDTRVTALVQDEQGRVVGVRGAAGHAGRDCDGFLLSAGPAHQGHPGEPSGRGSSPRIPTTGERRTC